MPYGPLCTLAKSACDTMSCKEVSKSIIIELCAIVYDDCLWDPKTAIDITPKEIQNLLSGDDGHGLILYPLGVVINYDNSKFKLSQHCGKFPNETGQMEPGR